MALEWIWIRWVPQVFGKGSKDTGDNPPFSDKKRILEEGSRIDWTSDRALIHAAPVNAARCAPQKGKRVSNEVLAAVSVHSLCT